MSVVECIHGCCCMYTQTCQLYQIGLFFLCAVCNVQVAVIVVSDLFVMCNAVSSSFLHGVQRVKRVIIITKPKHHDSNMNRSKNKKKE